LLALDSAPIIAALPHTIRASTAGREPALNRKSL
jgi:hypothetical protein